MKPAPVATTSSVHVAVAIAGGAPAALPRGSDALPAPTLSLGADDAMYALYALLNDQHDSQAATGKAEVTAKTDELHAALQKEIDDLKQAAADESGSGFFGSFGKLFSDLASDFVHGRLGDLVSDTKDDFAAMDNKKFWGDLAAGAKVVGAVAAIVVAAAATVVTLGGAAPALVAVTVAGVTLSAAALAENQVHYLEAAGVSPEIARGITVGAAVVGSLMTAGAGSAGGIGATVSASGDVATAVGGAADVRSASFDRDAEESQADATAEKNRSKQAQRQMNDVLAILQDLHASLTRAKDTLSSAIQTNDQAGVIAASIKA